MFFTFPFINKMCSLLQPGYFTFTFSFFPPKMLLIVVNSDLSAAILK